MPRRHSFPILTLVVILGAALFPVGCSDDSSPRSVVTIESLNSNEILESDVYNDGEDKEYGTADDFIIEDQVPVVLRNRPHDTGLALRANGPFSAVVFERYVVQFHGDETLPRLEGAINLRVPSGSTASGEVTMIPAGYKADESLPLRALRNGGELRFTAEVTFIGREEDSNDEVKASAVLPVHCANWTDASK